MADTLDEFVEENAKFLKLDNGETFTGTFLSYKIVPSEFDPEKQVVLYTLAAPSGRKVAFRTGSTALAKRMSKLQAGTAITLTRRGMGTQTKYLIESINDKEPLA